MKTIYLLIESDYEGAYTHGVYDTKMAAYKSLLMLKQKLVREALEFYRLTGEHAAEWCYRHPCDRLTVCEDKVWTIADLKELEGRENE